MAATFLMMTSGAALGQDGPTAAETAVPTPTGTPTTTETPTSQRDLYLDMPYTLGGFEPEIVITRGVEHLATLDPADPDDERTRSDLERLLEQVGADIDDMVSGYALAAQEDFFSFVVAIRIEGVEPGTLLPAYRPILDRGLPDSTSSTATIAGKEVLIVSSPGEGDEPVDLYVYDAGDTLWMVQGPKDVVEVTLQDLP